MPPLSGSQKALTYSFLNAMRLGASRIGYFPAIGALSLGGTTVTTKGIKPSIRIVDQQNASPNTVELQVRGSSTFTPAKGQEIIIGLGNLTHRIFAGHIQSVSVAQPRKNQKKPTFTIDAIDYSWQLDWKRVQGKSYTNTAVGTIAGDIVSTFATAFTVRVEANLTSTDFQSNHDERVSEALTRLMAMIGGYWYVDYDRVVHIFLNPEADGNAVTLDSANMRFQSFEYTEDLSQTRTRVRVTGGASTTTGTTSAGSTTLAVDDTRLFGSAGGYALVGANQITYTGKSVASGPGNLTGIPGSSTGSIAVDVAQGETVRVLAIAQDATAAAAIAALVGTGDGYLEHSIDDGQLGDAAARQRASGDLVQNKNPDKRVTYTTRDLFVRAGKTITVDLTNTETSQHISGTFQVQRMVISDIELSRARYPLRTVEAGNNRPDVFVSVGHLLE